MESLFCVSIARIISKILSLVLAALKSSFIYIKKKRAKRKTSPSLEALNISAPNMRMLFVFLGYNIFCCRIHLDIFVVVQNRLGTWCMYIFPQYFCNVFVQNKIHSAYKMYLLSNTQKMFSVNIEIRWRKILPLLIKNLNTISNVMYLDGYLCYMKKKNHLPMKIPTFIQY